MELEEYLGQFIEDVMPGASLGSLYKEALIPLACGYAIGLSTENMKKFMGIRAYLGSATAALKPNRSPQSHEIVELLRCHEQGVHFKAATIKVFPGADIQEQYIDELHRFS